MVVRGRKSRFTDVNACTPGKEPVSMLDDGLDNADNLQGQSRHHLRHVPEKRG